MTTADRQALERAVRLARKQQVAPALAPEGATAYERHLRAQLKELQALVLLAAVQEPTGGVEGPPVWPDAETGKLELPLSLEPNTALLVTRFANALADKLMKAQEKYGYEDGWMRADWLDECRQHLMEHIAKGDPRDVAAYCAFLWYHGASTAQHPDAPRQSAEARDTQEADARDAKRWRWVRANALWRDSVIPKHIKWIVEMPEPDTRAGVLTETSVGDELDAAVDAAIGRR